jgi:lysophospholipase L1-like esterase
VVSTGNLKGLVQPSDVPDLVYELKPHRSWLFIGKEVRTNEAGFRGKDFSKDRPRGVKRVVGVGDSVMFGWGVGEEESYMSLLEMALTRRAGGPVEVLNLAVPGYNTIQERAALEHKGLPLAPDLVLINYCLNDWSAPFFLPNPERKGTLIEKTVLFEELTRRLHRDAEAEYASLQGMDKVQAALERIRELTSARDVPVIFFIYPLPLNPAARDDLAKMATKRGFRHVDMYAAFEAYYKERGLRGLEDLMLNPRDSHPNPEGHRLIARTLEDPLLSLLPGQPP